MKWWQRDKSKQNYFTSMTYELWSFLNLPWLWYFYRVINIRKTWYSSEFEKEPKSRVADSIMPATLNASSQWLPRPPLIVSKVPLDALRQTSFRLYLPFVAMHWQPEKKKKKEWQVLDKLSFKLEKWGVHLRWRRSRGRRIGCSFPSRLIWTNRDRRLRYTNCNGFLLLPTFRDVFLNIYALHIE